MANEPIRLKDPITSYGILLFYITDTGQIKYLLAQRRDSIEYTDFLRGRYSHYNLETYFRLMTEEERERLRIHTFDELWDDLWVNHDNRFYRDIKAKAKAKFEGNYKTIQKLLDEPVTPILEPRWVFPKGKRNINESEIDCAFREFREETQMSLDYLNLLNVPPSKEIFKGSNGKLYGTVYYIAQVEKEIPIVTMHVNGLRTETVSEEISNLKWCTLGEALTLLAPWRQKLLIDANTKIRRFNRSGESLQKMI